MRNGTVKAGVVSKKVEANIPMWQNRRSINNMGMSKQLRDACQTWSMPTNEILAAID